MAAASFLFTLLHLLLLTVFFKTCKSATVFVFGDSYFDAGNNNYINTTTLDKANFRPYGITFFRYPTGRFSDGRLISDFIADNARIPFIRPFLEPGNGGLSHGVNFASAGAGALKETFRGSVIGLRTQLRYYNKVQAKLRRKLGRKKAINTLNRSVFLFSIGTNDYMSPFFSNSLGPLASYSESEYVKMVVGNLTIAIKDVYSGGGRRFGFLNVPPVGCLPGIRILNLKDSGCSKAASRLALLHNKALVKLLQELRRKLPGFRYSLFDFHTSLLQRINHPSEYGYKEGKDACCGSGKFRGEPSCGRSEFKLCKNVKDHVFWDSFHLTERVYKQLADQMWSCNTSCKSSLYNSQRGSYDLKTLFHSP